jgi:hypothetical protein
MHARDFVNLSAGIDSVYRPSIMCINVCTCAPAESTTSLAFLTIDLEQSMERAYWIFQALYIHSKSSPAAEVVVQVGCMQRSISAASSAAQADHLK